MSSLPTLVLPPLSAAYDAITQARLALYRRGTFRIHKLNVPVISVGNITTGGTGKTPLVELICRVLAEAEKKVCVLTRGYGRTNPNTRVLVSDGREVLAKARQAGDEAFMLAQNLKGLAAVVCDPDRVGAGQWAISQLGAEVFVLDDGFQHLRLARDLDIVTIDATFPWGDRYLLPYGRLRERLTGLSRTDCVVITRSEQSDNVTLLETEIKQLTNNHPIFLAETQTVAIKNLSGESLSVTRTEPTAAFCAVGNPQSFFRHLRREGFNVLLARSFPDHHVYSQDEIDRLSSEARKLGVTALFTTAKDAVKLGELKFELPCRVLETKISLADEAQFNAMILASVAGEAN